MWPVHRQNLGASNVDLCQVDQRTGASLLKLPDWSIVSMHMQSILFVRPPPQQQHRHTRTQLLTQGEQCWVSAGQPSLPGR